MFLQGFSKQENCLVDLCRELLLLPKEYWRSQEGKDDVFLLQNEEVKNTRNLKPSRDSYSSVYINLNISILPKSDDR